MNWRLALAIYLYTDWIMSHHSCWLSTLPERAQGGDQEWGSLGSGKTGRTGLQIDIFRRRFYEPNSCISLYLEKHGDVCSSWLAVNFMRPAATVCKNVCSVSCTSPFTKVTYILTFPHCLFGAVFQSYLKCCLLGYNPPFAPNKT